MHRAARYLNQLERSAHDFGGMPRYIIHVTNETYQQLRGVKRDTRS